MFISLQISAILIWFMFKQGLGEIDFYEEYKYWKGCYGNNSV